MLCSHTLQAVAIAINLELIFHVRLPDIARRQFPNHAAHLLPIALARHLRALARDAAGADTPTKRAQYLVGPIDQLVHELGVVCALYGDRNCGVVACGCPAFALLDLLWTFR